MSDGTAKTVVHSCKLDDTEVPGDPMASAMVRLAQAEYEDLDKCSNCEEPMLPTEPGDTCPMCLEWLAERARAMAGITGEETS